MPALLAVVALPAAVMGAVLVTIPAAAGTAPPALLDTCPPVPSGVGCTLPATPTPTSSPTLSTTPFPPGPPTNLAATAVTTGSVTLTWTASVRGCCTIVGYDIQYTQAFNDIVWQVSLGNVTTATINTLTRASEYRFVVTARDDQGRRSNQSNSVRVVTPVTDTGPDTVPPQAPTDLTATQTGASALLTWSPSTDNVGVTGYNVYRFDGLYISTLLATVTGTSYTVPLPATYNFFHVRARDAVGNLSASAGPVTVYVTGTPSTPPPRPCRVTYTTQSQWTGGFVASVTVHNTGTTAIDGWTLAFTFAGDQRITNAWNAAYTQSGAVVTARNADWNRVIPAGGSTTFGMQGSWTASNAPPAAFTLNGAACATG
ncbi:cellulose binding domain-containing protein [Phytohabitans rumicis]|uniref:cellulose binding domain-containing protein n=1 Tax=Phytohabitans rumicis TaxID=1076125 RepID=UPI0031F107BA